MPSPGPLQVLGKTVLSYEVTVTASPALYMVSNNGLPWFDYNFQDRQWESIPGGRVRAPLFHAPTSPDSPELQRATLIQQLENNITSPDRLITILKTIGTESVILARRQLEIARRVEEAISSSSLPFVACGHDYAGYSAALLALSEPPVYLQARNPVWFLWVTRQIPPEPSPLVRRTQWEFLLTE